MVSLGEVLWDLLPSGPQLGGAPANFAGQVGSLGGAAALVSRIGSDPLGERARERLVRLGVELSGLQQSPHAPTGTVGVTIDAAGQPRYTIHEGAAWDELEVTEAAVSLVKHARAVCFGTLAQRSLPSRTTLRALLDRVPDSALILCDLNLRAPFYDRTLVEDSLQRATVAKLNDHELTFLADWFGFPDSLEGQVQALAEQFNLEEVVLTLGAAGSGLWSHGRFIRGPQVTVTVVDTVGAGDAFAAAYLLGRLRNFSPTDRLYHATQVAAFVCTHAGALPELPEALTTPFRITRS